MSLRRCVRTFVGFAALVFAGCASVPSTDFRAAIVAELESRTNQALGEAHAPGQVTIPATVDLANGLSIDESAQVALCNNAAFQELLTDLGLARSDIVQAGLLPNPEVLFAFPFDPKPFKYAVELPLDAVVFRPHRLRSANAEMLRTQYRLIQAGIDLIRDARLAHIDWVAARDRNEIAKDNLKLRTRIAQLTEERRKAGDASGIEVATANVDALKASQEAARAERDLPVFEERLRHVLGLGAWRSEPLVPETVAVTVEEVDIGALEKEALTQRADVVAANHALNAAEARVRLAKLGWLRVFGIADATSGPSGHNYSPALRFAIPLFNQNEGAVARAEAERERAARQLQTVKDRAILEVRQAHSIYVQADADQRQWSQMIGPAVAEATARTEKAYRDGGVPLLLVLESSRQLIDTRGREVQLRADVDKSWSELERSVGRTLQDQGHIFAVDRRTP